MLMEILKKMKNNIINNFLLAYKRRLHYWAHEYKCKRMGDTRGAFKKKIDRCRYLQLPDLIETVSDFPD